MINRDAVLTARDAAQQSLQSLRDAQSHGVSLKRAVREGLATIILTDEKKYRDRKATVVPRA